MMKARFSFFLCSTLALNLGISTVHADEGMWRPADLKKQEAAMKKLGLKVPVTDLYDESKPSLKDAVVIFGGGCTGEVVSPNGLIFTNHHCGYGNVQAVSSITNNYLVDGFWAKNLQQEIPCPGLSVTFIRQIEEVTKHILKGIDSTTTEDDRKKMIATNIKNLEDGYNKVTKLNAEIKPFYNGNEYWITVKEVYRDVRLVGFPPNGIGKFGGDTDNWMWPRHTGDFGIFRVYANAKNQPADYHVNNVPYKAEQYFQINIGGIKEGDYSMVYGFPGTTQEYLSAAQLSQTQHISDPIRIASRAKKLAVWDEAMRQDPSIFLKYASKQSSVSNGFKKWQGEVRGLEINDVEGKKKAYEQRLLSKMANNSQEKDKLILAEIDATVEKSNPYLRAEESTRETVLAIEIVQQAQVLDNILKQYRNNVTVTDWDKFAEKTTKSLEGFYKNYDVATDQKVFDTLMPFYFEQPDVTVPETYKKAFANGGSKFFESWSNSVYHNSVLANKETALNLLKSYNPKDTIVIKEDPAWEIYNTIAMHNDKNIKSNMSTFRSRIDYLNRRYMAKQLEYMQDERNFFPDANQTLRLTYGPVKGIQPQGSNEYSFQQNLDAVIKKHNPNVAEFNIPQKLINLYNKKDYGRWAVNGSVPVTFIAANHTSGGNSGSPVLNAKGELIGINFDRIWDGTMSDIFYDPNLCRNISVDIRYVLFIIDKFGDAGWLLKEMKLVK